MGDYGTKTVILWTVKQYGGAEQSVTVDADNLYEAERVGAKLMDCEQRDCAARYKKTVVTRRWPTAGASR